MARLARIIVPGIAHHVTQRGNRREPIFFEAGDQEVYRDLLAEQAARARVSIWAYCLMPNHVHLVAVQHAGCSGEYVSCPRLFLCVSAACVSVSGREQRPSVSP
jgi:REP element-mobilizing transposase RayT